MTIFAVILKYPDRSVTENIRREFPNTLHHEYSNTFYLLQADNLTENIAEQVGIKGEKRDPQTSGFVLKLNNFNYSGYTSRNLWEWLTDEAVRDE